VSLFADIHDQPQGKFLEGGAFDDSGNFWFVAIDTGWVSYLTPEGKLVPGFNCNPPAEFGIGCEPQGTRWHDGKLYLTTRHEGIMVYDPQTKKLSTLVNTFRNQLFKGPNDLDFDAEGNLYFTDPWGTGPGPDEADRMGAVYQYSKDGVLRRLITTGSFPNGVAVSPNDNTLVVADYASNRMLYYTFLNGPIPACATTGATSIQQTASASAILKLIANILAVLKPCYIIGFFGEIPVANPPAAMGVASIGSGRLSISTPLPRPTSVEAGPERLIPGCLT